MPKRHSIVTLDFPPLQDGGISRWMDEIARGLIDRGEQVQVYTRGRKAAAFAHDRTYPARVLRLFGHGWVRRHRTYLALYRPWLGSRFQDGVVHAATFDLASALGKQEPSSHLVVYLHGLELREAARSGGTRLKRLREVWKFGHSFIANSQHVHRMAVDLGAPPEHTFVVHPAIDALRFSPEGPDLRTEWNAAGRTVLLTLGRLIPRKGQDTIISALPKLREAIPDILYVIAGAGSDRSRLEQRVEALGVERSVLFVGFMQEQLLPLAYRTADLYAMVARETPEDVEGFGITYLEAGASGRAVIGGRSGGVADAVVDGVTGRLVDPDNIDEVTDTIRETLVDRHRLRMLGAQGRTRVLQEMTREKMVHRLLEIIDR